MSDQLTLWPKSSVWASQLDCRTGWMTCSADCLQQLLWLIAWRKKNAEAPIDRGEVVSANLASVRRQLGALWDRDSLAPSPTGPLQGVPHHDSMGLKYVPTELSYVPTGSLTKSVLDHQHFLIHCIRRPSRLVEGCGSQSNWECDSAHDPD